MIVILKSRVCSGYERQLAIVDESDAPHRQSMTPVNDLRYCPVCQAAYPLEFAACPRDGTHLEGGTDRLVGIELRDTYKITHVLGEGGLGRVYHATHVRMPRSYAVKVPRGMWIDHPKSRLRFFNEAAAAGRLAHPNIASVLDFGELSTGLPYLVMEFAPGASLRQVMARGAMRCRDALVLVRQIASALSHAHDRGVIHRDLKPENVLVEAGHARIVDFGIAIMTDLGEEGRFTTKGVTIGTPHYMAPEQLYGAAIDERTDLYALGAMFYELLAGCRPFAAETNFEYIHHVVERTPPMFAARVPHLDIDARAEQLCRRLLAKRPQDRPDDRAVIAAIDEVLASGLGADDEQVAETVAPALDDLAVAPTLVPVHHESTQHVRRFWWNPFTWHRNPKGERHA